jgi:hypothetical protein
MLEKQKREMFEQDRIIVLQLNTKNVGLPNVAGKP